MKTCSALLIFCLMVVLGTAISEYAQREFMPVPCDNVSNKFQKFECGDGKCLVETKYSRKCDSVINCADARDEDPASCRTEHQRVCRELKASNADIFKCADGMCIEKNLKNNGKWDCRDKSDEGQ
ncbi:low-density lipoprotein receptor-related protein-like [Amphiura filiformis]|uniref:low-density lipoprotein receptor-related protein-like n=1 Tax=Amphiura filiformis TaxID=82378 RepID=UPI003B224BA2